MHDELHDLIICDPTIQAGAPCVRGTRVTVQAIVGRLDRGESKESLLMDWPHISLLELEAAQRYARDN